MTSALGWSLFVLGVAHVLYGVIKFRTTLAAAVSAGFIGQFSAPEERRTAFWFLALGPMLMVAGQVAAREPAAQLLIGYYLCATSVVGVAAFPKSPLWASLLISILMIAAGHGFL